MAKAKNKREVEVSEIGRQINEMTAALRGVRKGWMSDLVTLLQNDVTIPDSIKESMDATKVYNVIYDKVRDNVLKAAVLTNMKALKIKYEGIIEAAVA